MVRNVDYELRRRAVLTATINKYIREALPIASEDVAEDFDLSSATIRNIFAELEENGYQVRQQVKVPIEYKGIIIDSELKLDLLVENKVIIELKTVEELLPVHEAQLLTYMKLSGVKIGLLINFNEKILKDGIKRFVL